MRSPEIPFPVILQDFFLSRLIKQKGASERTVESYRDTFEMLLTYIDRTTGNQPSKLSMTDLDAPVILDFLDSLESDRGNCPRSRNARLSAIRSFMKYASVRDPASLLIANRVLAIPSKRFDQPVLGFLSRDEMNAILNAPDQTTWSGRRDAVLLATLYNTGARVSELIGLRGNSVLIDRETSVHLLGKGRRERVLPLWKSTARALRSWQARELVGPEDPVFPNRNGAALSRSGVRYRLAYAVARAKERCPSLAAKRISPHTIRHTTGMHLYESGVDLTTIALWLGHASTSTTHIYLEASLAMKEAALKRVHDPSPKPVRFQARDKLLAFLKGL